MTSETLPLVVEQTAKDEFNLLQRFSQAASVVLHFVGDQVHHEPKPCNSDHFRPPKKRNLPNTRD